MLLREITKMALMFRSGSLEDGHYEGYFQTASSTALKVFSKSSDSKSKELQTFGCWRSQERNLTLTCRISFVGLLWCVRSDHIPPTAVYPLHSSGNCVEPVTQGKLSQAHFDSITAHLIKFRL